MPNCDHRRSPVIRPARVALAGGIAVVAAVIAAAAWPGGARHHRAASPRRPVALSTLILGTCYDGGTDTVTVRDCAEPHQGEVIGTAELALPPRGPERTAQGSRDGCEQLWKAHLTDQQLAGATGLRLVYPEVDGQTQSVPCAVTSGRRVRGTLWRRLGVPRAQYQGFALRWLSMRTVDRGECFTLPSTRQIPDEIGVVPCDQPHDSVVMEGGDADILLDRDRVTALCGQAGLPPGSGPVVRVPTESEWGNGQHTTLCVATTAGRHVGENVAP